VVQRRRHYWSVSQSHYHHQQPRLLSVTNNLCLVDGHSVLSLLAVTWVTWSRSSTPFNCCWRERSPFSLPFHTGCVAIIDQQIVLFYKRVLNLSNVVLQTLLCLKQRSVNSLSLCITSDHWMSRAMRLKSVFGSTMFRIPLIRDIWFFYSCISSSWTFLFVLFYVFCTFLYCCTLYVCFVCYIYA